LRRRSACRSLARAARPPAWRARMPARLRELGNATGTLIVFCPRAKRILSSLCCQWTKPETTTVQPHRFCANEKESVPLVNVARRAQIIDEAAPACGAEARSACAPWALSMCSRRGVERPAAGPSCGPTRRSGLTPQHLRGQRCEPSHGGVDLFCENFTCPFSNGRPSLRQRHPTGSALIKMTPPRLPQFVMAVISVSKTRRFRSALSPGQSSLSKALRP